MPLLLLPSGAVVPVSLVGAPVGVEPEEHAARCLNLTLGSFPEGTRVLPVEAPPLELADLPPECWTWDEAAAALVLVSAILAAGAHW